MRNNSATLSNWADMLRGLYKMSDDWIEELRAIRWMWMCGLAQKPILIVAFCVESLQSAARAFTAAKGM